MQLTTTEAQGLIDPAIAALSASSLSAGDQARIDEYLAASRATNTARAYAAHWRHFAQWAAEHNYTALPCDPAHLAAYVTDLADTKAKPSTIQAKLSAISGEHKAAGHANPASSELVRKSMRGIRRTLTTRRTQKAAPTMAELTAMIDTLPKTTQGKRDKALLLLGFFGAFRRSELAGLMREDVKIKKGEMQITLTHSKTDQEGEGTLKRIPALPGHPLDPLAAMQAWLKVLGVQEGPLFRAVGRWDSIGTNALNDHTVAKIVKKAAEVAGLDPDAFSGHSLRAGFVTASYNAGTSEADIMDMTGHKSITVMRGYKRNAGTSQVKAVLALIDKV